MKNGISLFYIFICCFLCQYVTGNELDKKTSEETAIVTSHHIKINGEEIAYTATAGTLFLHDDKGNAKASIFYVSYIKNVDNKRQRPLTFCFNGGPGAASVWLHMGMLGPKRVDLKPDGFTSSPYQMTDNEFSLLDTTDLVFIDPVSTGYSKAAPGEDPKQFHGVEEDIKSVGEFIHLFTTRHNRWDSPKFLIGESYGTTRASGLAGHLLDEYKLYLNGIVLISSILDFQTIDFDEGNLLSYLLFLPSYTAVAWYHKKLEPELQKDLYAALKQAEMFALNDYALALLQGAALEEKKREQVAVNLARYTGLSVQTVKDNNLMIKMGSFTSELLREQKKTLGRFDGRYLGFACDACGGTFNYDPSATAIFGAFTGVFMDYVRTDLRWEKEDQYKVLTSLRPWNFGNATNCYLNMGDSLREAMIKNPMLKIYVGSGVYDLATPYFGTIYTFNHLGLDPSLRKNVTMSYFEAGHMMYTHRPSLEKLKKELVSFYGSSFANH
jgi:carboxypeptidase C (cathepsin A)